MRLKHIDITNYKNIAEQSLTFSDGVNCLIGNNGMGKTNVLDAIYFLSFCKSFVRQRDAEVIRHGESFMMLHGTYSRREATEDIRVALQAGKRKSVSRGGKEYQRLSQHIGLLPLVMVSPLDWDLIRGNGEERRRFMDQIIAQGNPQYMEALIRYAKAHEQRNSMLRNEMRDALLYETVEHAMCESAATIHSAREKWTHHFTPIFMEYYAAVAGDAEPVALNYVSHLNDATMEQALAATRERDLVLGYTSRGPHRDDIELTLGTHPMRNTGSQGQCKTYTIALRLAQYDFLRRHVPTTPILLLDDIFDKLDARRVEHIVDVVSSERFGQIFITDTNRTHLDEIMARQAGEHTMFIVENGTCVPAH